MAGRSSYMVPALARILSFESILQWQVPRYAWIAAGMLLVIPIGVLDVATGPYVPLSMFNILPVILVALCAGRTAGLAPAVMAGSLAFVDEYDKLPRDVGLGMVAWNFADDAVMFVVMVELGSRLRGALLRQKAMATLDPLTGLANMRGFREHTEQELSHANRSAAIISAAYIDCDNFKKVNDTAGHAEGDRVLRTVADVLRANLRAGDVPSRLGGDEFAILLPQCDAAHAESCVVRLRESLLAAMREHSWPVTFSIGLATFQPAPTGVDALLSRIDNLQYVAKHSGKNRIHIDQTMGESPTACPAAA